MSITYRRVYQNSDTVASGVVISQSPAGPIYEDGSEVVIYISIGPVQLKSARFVEKRAFAVMRVLS